MHRRSAFTLIEVLAALALIATAATLLLTAHSRALVQVSAIRRLEKASQIARELMASWQIPPIATMTDAKGVVAQEPRWSWRRRVRRSERTRNMATVEVTLTVYRRDDAGTDVAMETYTWLKRVKPREKN